MNSSMKSKEPVPLKYLFHLDRKIPARTFPRGHGQKPAERGGNPERKTCPSKRQSGCKSLCNLGMNLINNLSDDLTQDGDLDRVKSLKGVEDEISKF